MPNISLASTGIPNLLPMRGRSHDIPHLSEIIQYLCITNGHLSPQNEITPEIITGMQLGQAFESILLQRYALHEPNRFVVTGEIRCEGIALTPDVVDITIPSVDDFKLTWMSSSTSPDSLKFWKWWTQVICYAYAVEKAFNLPIRVVKLHVCHVKYYPPVMNEWRMDCSEEEIRGRWELVCTTSKTREFLAWWRERQMSQEVEEVGDGNR